MYGDSFDGDFMFDYCPAVQGLFVASGGSGHGYKFAPILGDLIADRVEMKSTPDVPAHRFKWRLKTEASSKSDVARCTDATYQVSLSSL